MESWWCENCARVCVLDVHGRCDGCGSDLLISCAALYVDLFAPMQMAALQAQPIPTNELQQSAYAET
jgi:hypothetical protein